MMIGTPQRENPIAVIIPLGEKAELVGQRLLADLRRAGITADMGYRGNMKKRLSRANESGAAFVLIIGDNELEKGEAQLKNLATGEQRAILLDHVAKALLS